MSSSPTAIDEYLNYQTEAEKKYGENTIVFYENAKEKDYTEKYIQKLLKDKVFPKITTEVVPLVKFYKAEIYHQNYEETHPDNPYVKSVSRPRLNRFKEKYGQLLKNN